MNLLIVTQKADRDDPILGFFHRWIAELAERFDRVTVICLFEGAHSFPPNVRVISLGKERGASKLEQLRRFYGAVIGERSRYGAVFVHMNPIYIVLAGVLWKLWGKRISLWYTHKQVDLKLRVAVVFADAVFTASKESFRLASPKVVVTGHGIGVESYAVPRAKPLGAEPIRIASVGRITPIKDPMTLIEAAHILRGSWKKRFEVAFLGAPATDADTAYAEEASRLIAARGLGDVVSFMGNVAPARMPAELAASDIAVNLTPTGGVDKAVLEAMAAGIPALSSNEAFRAYFGGYANELIFAHGDASDLAAKLMSLIETGNMAEIGADLQRTARERADVRALIGRLAEKIKSL